MRKRDIVYAALAFLLVSCAETGTNKTHIDTVKVDFLKIEHIAQSEGWIVNLETTDKSLLYDICRLNVHEDTFVVQSRSFLYTFASNGKFLGSVSQRGHARNEYIQISNVFFEGGTVGVYDFNKKAVSRFDLRGRLLSVQKCDIADEGVFPFHVYPWNGGYIALNSYGGETEDRKTLCFLNKELTSGKPMEGRSLSTGFSTYDDISIDQKGNVLYCELLCDTLFTVNDDELAPLLAIDFGEYALPYDIARKDVYERADYADKSIKGGKKFAGMARYYQRIDDKIYFSCLFSDVGSLLCQYDEDEGTTRLFTVDFDNQKYTAQSFFFIKDNMVYWEIRDKKDLSLNPGLFVFSLDTLA